MVLIVQIAIAGAQILGKAFLAAGRQAAANAKYRPEAISGDVAGMRNATSGSFTDRLTREHLMTLDEARLILNAKKEDPMETVLQHCEHLFKANSPPAAPPKPQPGKKSTSQYWSHYLQSKIVRARERIEAETKAAEAEHSAPIQNADAPPPPPPSQNQGS
ncbi:uncharacterized protein PHACADRAFT_197043 [Phanerochaete carnosa HHB-10118-sp]|uniref:Mitochondrial import inner membrane translocase subunit TIM16 n=1 Tax=Phanerochaete carnosa (strain HHB-10118-sp) TaxID=650164 RepID=K5W613_PHACS|nr:uncharacterized protein PHACADRAFT_197043 [Phanerochaete carnosa HHB-10118-sp]EKM54610.1 hypothetical protein PHACADRAFT_197043 [Phanerochaete carnosa HHB-10118-sp]